MNTTKNVAFTVLTAAPHRFPMLLSTLILLISACAWLGVSGLARGQALTPPAVQGILFMRFS